MSLKHLKAFDHPDTKRCKGPEEQENITLLFFFLERGKSQMCVPECL